MIKVDIKKLDYCIDQCSALAIDGRLPQTERDEMLRLGEELTNVRTKLLSAQFTNDLKHINDAAKELRKVNRSLGNAKQKLDEIVDIVKDITGVVAALEEVVKIVAGLSPK
jgi:tRNA A22 N-methylase